MDVLMRVGMRGRPGHSLLKDIELLRNFTLYSRLIVQGNHAIQLRPFPCAANPLAQVKMKPDAEFGVFPGIDGRFAGSQPSRHQTGAGYDAMLMRFYDAPIYPRALTEIISTDDEIFFIA